MSFSFGENWQRYSRVLDEGRIAEAEDSLRRLVEPAMLMGASFFDVGAGSGLFSIAAIRLGAKRVVAIDRDAGCLVAMRRNVERFLQPELRDSIEIRQGDILCLGPSWGSEFDVVYAWGSLHHTGAMWRAMENAALRCGSGGRLVLAIYNETRWSPLWLRIKRMYHAAPLPVRLAMVGALWTPRATVRLFGGRHPLRSERGMSVWYDAVDWLGGLPYEYARPEQIVDFMRGRGFNPVRVLPTRRSGCNEFVFERVGVS